jgi:tetrapyrrole methylase family protein/MazG family protein
MDFSEDRPLYRLMEIARVLRMPGGCAWDRAQDYRSLRPYLIEEAYELYDAIDTGDPEHMKEELGDLLYQIYAHSQIASEEGTFDIDDVAAGIGEKLVRRHPHVFGDERVASAAEVSDRWEQIKKKEKKNRESALDGVPAHLPALLRAYRVQQKVSRLGFDWGNTEDAAGKLEEEVMEFHRAVNQGEADRIREEAGDVLFSVVNLLRLMDIDPETALRETTEKFMTRFRHMEGESGRLGRSLEDMDLEEMEELWQAAKERLSRDQLSKK